MPSRIAMTAMIRESRTTTSACLGMTPLSMICPSRSGVATTRAESRMTRARNTPIWDLYGRA
jgi:hypothetical protein